MRVIAGIARGRKLAAPKKSDLRPTSDRVKENIFNILGDRVYGADVLDLYAGSGALAIEALSRGAGSAVLVDNDAKAAKTMGDNLAACRFDDRSTVIKADISRALEMLRDSGQRFDLIFLDPPYKIDAAELRKVLTELPGCLSEDALIVLEHAAVLAESPLEALSLIDSRRYGGTYISFFRRS